MPPVTSTLPPPRSVLMAALDLPEVFIVRSDAVIVPPPVVMMPPALSPVVVISESVIVTDVPSPDELLVVAEPP